MSNKSRLAIVSTLWLTTAAWAGPQFEAQLSACSGINCAGTTMRGVHQRDEPFIIQIFGKAGECLRLDVSSQTQDMAMAIISPSVWDGAISDDRNFDGGDTRPLLFFDPLPWTGWYTVIVSHFDHAPVTGRFTLEYGRYPTGNANCVTEPVVTAGGSSQQSRFTGDFWSRTTKPTKSSER
jgi:hypothetical protein